MNEPCIDLTGKLIIKVALGDDIRRILITNEDITYDELVLMMQRVYRGKLNSTDDIVIKYKDEDNDLITIFDSSDLTFAIQCSRILKITLFVNNKPEPLQTDEIKMIKGELKHIRDRCNKLLDKLDERQPQDPTSTTAADSSSGSKDIPRPVMESPRRPSPSPRMPPPTSVAGSKEFDPLSTQRSVDDQQNKVMSSFGISGDTPIATTERPGTPDSVSSIGSSSGQRQAPQQPGGIPSQTGTPVHQGQQPGMYGGSGSKIPPWQSPSPQSQGQPQGQPQVQPGQFPTQQAPGFPPSSSQPQQQQQPHFPGQATPSQPQSYPGVAPAPTSQTPSFPGTAPTSQPQSFPVGAPTPSSQPGYGPSPTAQFGSYSQQGGPGQSFPGQPQQPQTQQMPYTQGQQGQSGQQQHQYGYSQQQQPQQPPSGPGSAPGQAPAGGNPYAKQGPGYGTGYPRPAANYSQGYQ